SRRRCRTCIRYSQGVRKVYGKGLSARTAEVSGRTPDTADFSFSINKIAVGTRIAYIQASLFRPRLHGHLPHPRHLRPGPAAVPPAWPPAQGVAAGRRRAPGAGGGGGLGRGRLDLGCVVL